MMDREFPTSQGLLILPHLRIQNANAISSPLTHGFPSMTAFLGLMWALERKLSDDPQRLYFDSIGVICHGFEEQVTTDGYVRKFKLTRNPVDRDGSTAAIVEEGRIHLDLTLVLGVSASESNSLLNADQQQRADAAARIADIVAGMRIAGGSVLPTKPGLAPRSRPQLIRLAEDPEQQERTFRALCRRWLPGFALVCRDDLLQQRHARLRESDPTATALDAWLDLSRFNWRPVRATTEAEANLDSKGKVEWAHDRSEGWIVPIPVGYGALSELHPAGTVQRARDDTTDFRFVESLYSIGQWIGPHRLSHPRELLWYAHSDVDQGLYRCCNDYSRHSAIAID